MKFLNFLKEENINVLTLYQGNKIIPNPRPDRVLSGSDRLLCFGKLEAMRSMIPPKTRKKRQPKVADLDFDRSVISDQQFDNEGSPQG